MSATIRKEGSALSLLFCIASIYIAYLSWAVLQERIATTPYGSDRRIFRSALVLNSAQSIAATCTGSVYLLIRNNQRTPRAFWRSVYLNKQVLFRFIFIAISTSLASPFGYKSLKYIDYPTQILGKSCKLLPVMAIGVLVYGRKFPPHKYLVVGMVTLGVALFTLYHPVDPKKAKTSGSSSLWGLFLLGINLLLDGLTNSTQDQMFAAYKELSGPSMMIGMNVMSSVFTIFYLLLPFNTELSAAFSFMHAHPRIVVDILAFAFCGAMGQLAIFYTLEKFGSLVLVTVTLTRKMFTMLLSVIWFNHPLSLGQYAGVSLVFGGIIFEAYEKRSSDQVKKRLQVQALPDGMRKGKANGHTNGNGSTFDHKKVT